MGLSMRRPSLEVVLAGILAVVVGGAVVVRVAARTEPPSDTSSSGGLFGASFTAGICLGFTGTASGAPVAAEDTSTVEGVARALEEIRELEFTEVPEPRYVSADQMSEEIRASFTEDYPDEDAELDERALTLLGAIPPDVGIKSSLSGFLGEQVAGYYDLESGDVVVRTGGDELTPADKVTLAHELDHALTDQVLGIPLKETPNPGEEDAALAARALVEGDATLAMSQFAARALSVEEQLSEDLLAFPDQGPVLQLEEIPHYLTRTMVFPYLEGLNFVCDLQIDGGWEAVDRAYADPPTTSAQILFPRRYEAGEGAIDPRDPGALGAGWERADISALGAADLLFLFEAPGNDLQRSLGRPLDLAAAWAGGEMHLWTQGLQSALGIALVQREGESSLCESVGRWYEAAFEGRAQDPADGETLAVDGDRQDAVLRCSGTEVRLGIGPDLATARDLAR
jgi:hypothetical protein